MKKAFLNVGAVILAVSLCFGVACNKEKPNGNVDTFKGVMSEQSYKSKETAAEAFIANEVGGENLEVTFIEYVKEADLTAAEISELNVEGTVDSAEKGKAVYSVADKEKVTVRTAYAEESEEDNKEQRVYILYIDGEYRYYTPAPQVDENITRSYFEDVFDMSKYVNCSMDVESVISGSNKVTFNGKEIEVNISSNDCNGYCKNTEYISETYIKMTINGNSGDMVANNVTEIFHTFEIETEQGVTVIVSKSGTNDYELYEESSSSVVGSTMSSLGYNVGDHTYYVKTENGFSLRSDMLGKYIKDCLDQTEFPDGDLINSFSIDSDTAIDVYVEDGRLSRMEGIVSYKMDFTTEGLNIQFDSSNISNSRYYDFGTTVIELPEQVSALLASNGYTVKA